MAINIRTYSREDGSSHAGIWKGLPPRDLVGQNAPRPNRSRSDVSIQVDVSGGGSRTIGNGRGDADRGTMGRRKDKELKNKGATPLYSHEDIREQYCINSKELEALERARRGKGFFGCLSSHKDKSCKKKRSFFALCVRRASDENLYNGCNKPVQNTSRSVTLPALKPYTVPLKDADGGSDQPTFRTRPQSFCTTDPRRYSIQAPNQFGMTGSHGSDAHMMQSQDSWKSNTLPLHRTYSEVQDPGLDQLNASRPFRYGGRLAYTQPNTPELSAALHRRQMMSSEASAISAIGDEQRRMTGSSKHVSFDASSPNSEIYTSAVPANSKSQERLLDSGRKTPEFLNYPPQVTIPMNHHPPGESKRSQGDSSTFSPVLARAILLERLRQASMRTQATQTEGYYNSCLMSTGSLSPYPASCFSTESISTHTRQVQTNFEPREHPSIPRRLTKSYSNVDSCNAPIDGYMKAESDPEFHPPQARGIIGRNDFSLSQPEELDGGDYSPPSPSATRRHTSSSGTDSGHIRRRQLLKALSEGTILLDRRKALSFATGYVDVDVHQSQSPQEELAIGRVLVHDSSRRHQFGSAYDDDDDAFAYPSAGGPLMDVHRRADVNLSTAASSSDTTRSLLCSDVDVGDVDWLSDPETMPPPPPMENPAESAGCPSTPPVRSRHQLSLPSQKSFDSISTGDELASANSLATVVAIDSGEGNATPRPSAQPHEEEDSEREIMVQFPPWPSDMEVIPAPPNFATSGDAGIVSPPPPEAPAHSERTPLRDMQNRFKSLSETITSVDSDSTSERRVTEHETSAGSSEPLSPASDLHSPEGGLPADSVGDESSDGAFLTAMSGTAVPAAGGLTVAGGNGSLSRSFRDLSEAESSRNSTLRMTDISIYEDANCRTTTNDDAAEPDPAAEVDPFPEDPLQSPADRRGAASSTNESNNDGRESSTSGSYSLDAGQSHDETPAGDTLPPPPLEDIPSPTAPSTTLSAAARRLSYRSASKSEDSKRYSRYFDESGAPIGADSDLPSFEPPEEFSGSSSAWPPPPTSPSPPPPPPPEESSPPPESTPVDRRKLIEGMKLQFPPGATMFSAADGSLQTPAAEELRPIAKTASSARRRNASGMHRAEIESSPSDEEEESNSHRKRPVSGSCARTRGSRSTPSKTPSVESKPFVVADLVLKKRERDAGGAASGGGMVRSPAMHEGFRKEDWVVERSTPTAECSVQADPTVLVHHASVSEPGSHPADQEPDRLAPAPTEPKKHLSCESLRSISPGSDNVFVVDTKSGVPASAGSEVVIPPEGFQDSPVNLRAAWPVEGRDSNSGIEASDGCKRKHRDSARGQRAQSCSLPVAESSPQNLSGSTKSLEAPADWEDSPSAGRKNSSGTERGPNRAVSAGDMCWFPETQLPPKRQLTVRAKSEERERGNRSGRRHLARSVDASWESLGSSRTSCDGTPLEDEDAGIYSASYQSASWAYIGETDELQVWRRPITPTPGPSSTDGEDSSTASEKDFRRKYTAITHRMVHRKSSVEMFRRLATSTFECDDVVMVKRQSGEFGFRIHGSRPVVVSAIEPGTPAEESGLQVGDILIAINDVNVLDSSHSEVVRIAHAGSDELKLEVARTCHVLAMGTDAILDDDDPSKIPMATDSPVVAGYLWKRSQSSNSGNSNNSAVCWYRRWFSLRRDNCLYYYKNQESSQPLGAVSLLHYAVTRSSFQDRTHGLVLSKGGSVRHWLAAETEELVEVWQNAMNQASRSATQHDAWLDVCTQNILLSPASIGAPDCLGHLMKLGHRAKEWQRRFCLLKDACLYFYVDLSAASALGAIHLHGYRVQSTGTASSGERRKYAFELLPPEPRMRHFHFYTDSENDRKRWIAALEYSIDRWIRVG